jgi:hypothetical protein
VFAPNAGKMLELRPHRTPKGTVVGKQHAIFFVDKGE